MQVIERELEAMSRSELLDHLDLLHHTQHQAEVQILRAAAQHAILHNPDTLDPAVSKLNGRERAKRFGGHGTPLVAEFAAAEFGARLGLSSYSARELIGDALDLMHRFPQLWGRVQAGEVKVSYARFVTKKTRDLTAEQAGYVDARVAEPADGRVTWTRFETLVEAAVKSADPEAAAERERQAAAQQFAKATRSAENGMRGFYIRAQFGIIAVLDARVTYLAEALRQLGDDSPVDERRVKAILFLANPTHAAQLLQAYAAWKDRPADPPLPPDDEVAPHAPASATDDKGSAADPATGEKPSIDWSKLLPTVVLYLHLYGGLDTDGLARVEGMGPVTDSWIRRHLGPHARFRVTPVLDLAGQAPVDGYEIPDRHRKAVHLITPADIFPFSTNLTRTKEVDHTEPFDHTAATDGSGQSRVGNYGPMTRFHHRIKTHGDWQVKQPFPGIYIWRDPHGATYLVDHTGTRRTNNAHTTSGPTSRIEAYFSQLTLAA
jgi:hypothetical protein